MITRRLYQFTCAACHKARRQTFAKGKATTGMCRPCRTIVLAAASKDQLKLFGMDVVIDETMPPNTFELRNHTSYGTAEIQEKEQIQDVSSV